MDQYEEAYERIGLSEKKRRELKNLSGLSPETAAAYSAFLIETVIISGDHREVTNREISSAKLV
jgi:hypothetical protein